MNPLRYGRFFALSILGAWCVGCGGQAEPASSSAQGGSGGTSSTTATGSGGTSSTTAAESGGTSSTTAAESGGTSSTTAAESGGTSSTTAAESGGTSSTSTTDFSLTEDLLGIWIVGWSGGQDHYSWIRFSNYDDTLGGQADILNVTGGGLAWTPYFGCEGQGRWYLTARPNTISLRMPTGCRDTEVTVEALSVRSGPGSGMFAKAILEANVVVSGVAGSGDNPIGGFQYPDSQCDAAMTSCQSPV
jgi:hypothetical protein